MIPSLLGHYRCWVGGSTLDGPGVGSTGGWDGGGNALVCSWCGGHGWFKAFLTLCVTVTHFFLLSCHTFVLTAHSLSSLFDRSTWLDHVLLHQPLKIKLTVILLCQESAEHHSAFICCVGTKWRQADQIHRVGNLAVSQKAFCCQHFRVSTECWNYFLHPRAALHSWLQPM